MSIIRALKTTIKRDAERIYSLVSIITSFLIILIYFKVISDSPYEVDQKFFRAPCAVFNHILYRVPVQIYSYVLFITQIVLVLTILSWLKPQGKIAKFLSAYEALTILCLLTFALLMVGGIWLDNYYVLFVAIIIPLFYIAFLGYRKSHEPCTFRKEDFLKMINIGKKEVGISREMGISVFILSGLTIFGTSLLYLKIIPTTEEINLSWILFAVLLTPFWEELFFRAYFLNRINDSLKDYFWSIIFSSFWFAFYHTDFLEKLPGHFDFGLFYWRFFGGIGFGVAYLCFKNLIVKKQWKVEKQLWIPIIFHGVWNFFALLYKAGIMDIFLL